MKKFYQLVLLLIIFDLVNIGTIKAKAKSLETKCHTVFEINKDKQIRICQRFGKDLNYSLKQSFDGVGGQLQRTTQSNQQPKGYSSTNQAGNARLYRKQYYGQQVQTQQTNRHTANQTNRSVTTTSRSSQNRQVTKVTRKKRD